MRRSTIAIVVLLMLAIPFQGFAAAMQSGCALGHNRSNTGAITLHQHDGNNHHAAIHQHYGHDDQAAVRGQDAETDSDAGAATECNCSTCGLGTGLPVSKIETTLTVSATAPLGGFVYLQVVVITGGPERPPRIILV